jgi:hypothetical protein
MSNLFSIAAGMTAPKLTGNTGAGGGGGAGGAGGGDKSNYWSLRWCGYWYWYWVSSCSIRNCYGS